MKTQISRRALLTGGPLTFAACETASGAYFGKTDPPSSQRLLYLINEPDSLDPAKVTGGDESFIVPALFEGLTNFHPSTCGPMAALATHYHVSRDFTQYRFYLHGHPRPGGVRLANTDTLRLQYRSGILDRDFSRGNAAPPDTTPGRWSDGSAITAGDFVYSWRRLIDPETAAPQYAYLLFYVRNAEAINAGKLPPEMLGVRALDEFTFEIDLSSPTTFFLQLTSKAALAAVPRQAIEAARLRGAESSWTEPAYIVTSGAFILRERRPYDRVVLKKNPRYYESDLVALDEIAFLPVSDAATSLNLYKTGAAHAMPGDRLPPLFTSAVQRKRDGYTARAFYHIHPVFNTTRPPFNNVLVRYALNMATEKRELAGVFGEGRNPARTFVPPFEAYQSPASVLVPIGGRVYDVLSYDPAAARELLARAGYANGVAPDGRQFTSEFRIPQVPFSQPIAAILQQQWRKNLNIAVQVVIQELKAYIPAIHTGQFEMVMNGGGADYADPNTYLNLFQAGGDFNPVWSDPAYDAMLKTANSTADRAARLRELAQCEAHLLRAMPMLPLLFYGFAGFTKPYVRGLSTNLLDVHPFKYVWIDTKWKPERS
jgi:ABC-type oligopeptide transport system substrate-binding subunit